MNIFIHKPPSEYWKGPKLPVLQVWLTGIITAMLFLHTLVSQAQSIEGRVVDEERQPLPFASVIIGKTGRAVSADKSGKYAIKDLPSGTYTLQASSIGYAMQKKTVQVGEDNGPIDFQLQKIETSLDEVVVVSGNMASMILDKLSSTPKLKRRIKSYRAVADCRIESVGNLAEYPELLRKGLRLASALLGYKKIFKCMEAHPDMMINIRGEVSFDKGSLSLADRVVSDCSSGISEAEKEAFLDKKWEMDKNLYDYLYDTIRKLKKEQHKPDDKRRQGSKLKYLGTYTENEHRIHVLKSKNYEIHVDADCWQIYRMSLYEENGRKDIECKEYAQGVFLPIYLHQEDISDLDENYKWKMVNTISYSVQNVQ